MDIAISDYWISISTLSSNIVTTLGIGGIIFFLISRRHSLNEFEFTVMVSCVERFQRLFPKMLEDIDDPVKFKEYIDLANEELFYFQRGYIPKEVMVEWIDGMLIYLPLYADGIEQPVNTDQLLFKDAHQEGYLRGYPRIRLTFRISSKQIEKDEDGRVRLRSRKRVIKEICANLGIRLSDKHFKSAMLDES